MLLKVRPLRYRGRRLPWREVENGPAYVGELTTYSMHSDRHGCYRAVRLVKPSDGLGTRLLPELFEPELVQISNRALHIRGFERWDGEEGGFSVLQEWYCEVPG